MQWKCRHATLAASHIDLQQHVATCADQIESVQSELHSYTKLTANEILTLNNDVSVTKQVCEHKKEETAELQLVIDSLLQQAAAKTLAHSQVGFQVAILFPQILLHSPTGSLLQVLWAHDKPRLVRVLFSIGSREVGHCH